LRAAYHCDVVIMITLELAETDPDLWTNTLVGDLVRQLGQALLERQYLDQILSGTKPKPRFFALGGDKCRRGTFDLIAP
jgi:hypothetical protein